MANPSQTLGPYGFRGLTDAPTNYGDAIQAENVEWQGDWIQTRKGSTILYTLPFTTDKILLQKEFKGRTNFKIHVVVSINHAFPDSYHVSVFRSGESTLLGDFYIPGINGRPSCVEFAGKLFLFLPATTDSQFTIWEIMTEAPYYQALLMDPFVTVNDDPGTYRPVNDPFRGIFGVSFMDRIFSVQDSDPWNVWYSNYNDANGWPYENFFSPFGDSNEPLTGLAVFNKQIISFTRSGIAVTQFGGKGLEESRVLKQNTGAICQQAICNIGNALVFLSEDGLLSLDLSGNVTDTIGEAINSKTLRDCKESFVDATLTYMPNKRQLWLAIPSANKLFVLDLRTSNWSTISWTHHDSENRICTLGTSKQSNGIEQATASYVTSAGVGVISCFNSNTYSDQHPEGNMSYRSQWISHSLPFVGQSLFRLFSACWLTLKDMGANKLRLLWSTKGQVIGGYTSVPQYVDFTQEGPWEMSRVGTAEVGTYYCAPYLGEQDYEHKVCFRGVQRGRWIQLGLIGLYNVGNTSTQAWAAKRFRILTKVSNTEREN